MTVRDTLELEQYIIKHTDTKNTDELRNYAYSKNIKSYKDYLIQWVNDIEKQMKLKEILI